jgi:hypothetical protein
MNPLPTARGSRPARIDSLPWPGTGVCTRGNREGDTARKWRNYSEQQSDSLRAHTLLHRYSANGAFINRQLGDPAKLARVLLELAAMDRPPKQFLAGSDAVTKVTSALEGRLQEIRAHKDLSSSTDGNF